MLQLCMEIEQRNLLKLFLEEEDKVEPKGVKLIKIYFKHM
jgi:hypothetical protein